MYTIMYSTRSPIRHILFFTPLALCCQDTVEYPAGYIMAWQRNSLLITPPFRDFFRSESSINRSAAPPSAVCVHASHAALAPAFSSHSSSLHIVLKTRSLAGDQDQVHSPQHCSSLPHNPHIAGVCFTLVCIGRNALKWSRLVGLIARCCTAEHDVGVFCRRWVGQVALPRTTLCAGF